MANETGIKITNFNEVIEHMKKLDLLHKDTMSKTRRALKIPFLAMKSAARKNLKAQGSMRNHALYRGLAVGSRLSKTKGYMTVAFGGKAATSYDTVGKTKSGRDKKRASKGSVNHFHLVNSGTSYRSHKKGKSVGAVGKGTSNRPNMNKSFRVGFADRAIKPLIPTIPSIYIKEFNKILNQVKTVGV